jgi:hypothetical protein
MAAVTVKAWLEGHQFDLQELAALLPSGDHRVVREDDGYYLTSPDIDNPPQGTASHDVAERLLTRANGLARAKKADFRPVSLTGKYSDTSGVSTVIAAASAEIRSHGQASAVVTTADGHVKPDPPSPWPNRLALADANPELGKVLETLARGDKLDWFAQWKVYERIVKAAGSEDEVRRKGWATDRQQRAFRASANLEQVSGDAARHAVDKGTGSPKETMTMDDGQAFISELVRQWLETL